jgi:hypothetical protein
LDSAKLNDWMQVVGIFAVVASLIFAGLQMRQTQTIAIANQYQERYSASMEFFAAREQSEAERRRLGERILAAYGLPSGYDETVTAEAFGGDYMFSRMMVLIYDNLHFQYMAGYITDEAWMAYRNQLRSQLGRPMVRYIIAT